MYMGASYFSRMLIEARVAMLTLIIYTFPYTYCYSQTNKNKDRKKHKHKYIHKISMKEDEDYIFRFVSKKLEIYVTCHNAIPTSIIASITVQNVTFVLMLSNVLVWTSSRWFIYD